VATGQTLLNIMEMLDHELQLQQGELDVARALTALNAAQDFFETFASQRPGVLGGITGTVTTAASTEFTTFPPSVLRLDKLYFINSSTSRPLWALVPIDEVGGHAPAGTWPFHISVSTSPGRPTAYWTNGRNIYWNPLPDGTHTIRWYGFASASDITADATFAYPDSVMLPLASFASRLMKEGVGDDPTSTQQLAMSSFGPVLDALGRFWRDRAPGFAYTRQHTT